MNNMNAHICTNDNSTGRSRLI